MSTVSMAFDGNELHLPAHTQLLEVRCPSSQEHMTSARNAQSHPLLLAAASVEAPSRPTMVNCYSDEEVHLASCSSSKIGPDPRVYELKLGESTCIISQDNSSLSRVHVSEPHLAANRAP